MNTKKSRLSQPTSTWKKDDWIAAAKILARKDKPAKRKGFIDRILYQKFINDLADRVKKHGVTKNKKRGGRPEKWSLEAAEEILKDNEYIRKELAEKQGVAPSKISNRKIAEHLGYSDAFSEYREITGLTKGQTAYKIEKTLNNLKYKIKNS